ncbi:MAG: hypothetical protein AABX17_03925 [Nanoarchaeota archaeon]
MDIFDNQILCKKCNKIMKPTLISKNGFNLRTIRCEKCNEIIVHPADKAEYDEFMRLKNKEFEVKMRMVGNSYAISIPREIVDFMHEQENMMDNMVKLCFDNANRLSLMFNTPENAENENSNRRVVSSKEVRIVRNNKPVMHVKQVYDSANPQNNRTIRIIKNKQNGKEQEEMEED